MPDRRRARAPRDLRRERQGDGEHGRSGAGQAALCTARRRGQADDAARPEGRGHARARRRVRRLPVPDPARAGRIGLAVRHRAGRGRDPPPPRGSRRARRHRRLPGVCHDAPAAALRAAGVQLPRRAGHGRPRRVPGRVRLERDHDLRRRGRPRLREGPGHQDRAGRGGRSRAIRPTARGASSPTDGAGRKGRSDEHAASSETTRPGDLPVGSAREFLSASLAGVGPGDCAGAPAGEPRASGVLRRDARPHQLVVRRLHLRQPRHGPGRRLQVRQGRDDQASARLRHQDRRRRSTGWASPTTPSTSASCGWRTSPARSLSKLPIAQKLVVHDAGRRPAHLPVARHVHDRGQAGQGADQSPRSRAPSGRRTTRSPTRRTSPASSRPSAPTSGPPRRTTATCTATSSSGTAPRCRRCRSARSIRSHPEDLWSWMDAQRKAGNELLAISHNANLSRRPHVPDRRRQQGPADRRGLGRVARSQRAADRDQADQGTVGDPPAAVAERRVRELRDHDLPAGQS